MPDLSFQIEGAEAVPYAMAPTLAFKLRIASADAEETIHSVALRCQIQIDTTRRHYNTEEKNRLMDLFGEPERWGQTLRTMLWTHTSTVVPPFVGSTLVDLPVPCTFDFNVAAAKYFAGLEDGEVPLSFLFSGTIFYEASEDGLQVTQIPWDRESVYRLPVKIWKEMIDIYYPNTAWLCLRRDIFDRLYQYKRERGIPTWEQAVEGILPPETAPAVELDQTVDQKFEERVA
ncbi:MAG: hypothetical protein QOH71_3652 [Blastocatellia bacterium]|jgi:hypothetical protein|nr:hypothetical protein [Blastocatellia bacterium]